MSLHLLETEVHVESRSLVTPTGWQANRDPEALQRLHVGGELGLGLVKLAPVGRGDFLRLRRFDGAARGQHFDGALDVVVALFNQVSNFLAGHGGGRAAVGDEGAHAWTPSEMAGTAALGLRPGFLRSGTNLALKAWNAVSR